MLSFFLSQHHTKRAYACWATCRYVDVQLAAPILIICPIETDKLWVAAVNIVCLCLLACACRYVDVRLAACYVAESLLRLVGHKLGHEPRRALYPELLKRLDDSNNGVSCRTLCWDSLLIQPLVG
jgi:hypothetical protein